jgi:hypothetical protein
VIEYLVDERAIWLIPEVAAQMEAEGDPSSRCPKKKRERLDWNLVGF